ncbi:MAG: hypothetical protein HC908_14975 [Calothrix sp. SM1_7_51]|nr:hypothetical protein [Calothrix sp. SM1_7_51]
MWLVNITCSEEAWKQNAIEFKAMTQKYQCEVITSKKMTDGTRIMAYKLEDVSDAENFQTECTNFAGFTSDFESL